VVPALAVSAFAVALALFVALAFLALALLAAAAGGLFDGERAGACHQGQSKHHHGETKCLGIILSSI